MFRPIPLTVIYYAERLLAVCSDDSSANGLTAPTARPRA